MTYTSIDMLTETPDTEDGVHLTVAAACRRVGKFGEFVRLDGVFSTGDTGYITVDSKHFDKIEPYIAALKAGEEVHVPVFLGESGKWRFSHLTAGKAPAPVVAAKEPPAVKKLQPKLDNIVPVRLDVDTVSTINELAENLCLLRRDSLYRCLILRGLDSIKDDLEESILYGESGEEVIDRLLAQLR